MITEKSGFLQLVEHGDLVMADRGFTIAEELAVRGAFLTIPEFSKAKKQFTMQDVERSRKIARVRIHVERCMERLKNYQILSSVLPISMLPHIDNIQLICAALSNLHPPLVK